MQAAEYQQLCQRTECDQLKSRVQMYGVRPGCPEGVDLLAPIRLNHAIIGLTGEVGELASLLQKWIYYKKQYTAEELKKQFMLEFGDALWYIAEGLNALGLDMDQVMEANIQKLKVRYPDKYEDVRAEESNRNREAEEQVEGIKPLVAPTPKTFKGVEVKCRQCLGTGKVYVSDGEGGESPVNCGMCSGRGIVWNKEESDPKPAKVGSKAFASMYGDPRGKDHPNPFGYNDPIPGADPASVDGEEDIHQVKPTVGIGRFQEPPTDHMGCNPPTVTTLQTWEQKLLATPLKPNGCPLCHGSGYHRYPDFADGTPNFSDSSPCGYCAGLGVKS